MKHKHAEFIIAWANGEEVEYQVNAEEGCKPIPSEWKPIFKGWSWDADFSIRYRIKPTARAFKEFPLYGGYMLRFYPSYTGWMCGISNEMMDAIEGTYK